MIKKRKNNNQKNDFGLELLKKVFKYSNITISPYWPDTSEEERLKNRLIVVRREIKYLKNQITKKTRKFPRPNEEREQWQIHRDYNILMEKKVEIVASIKKIKQQNKIKKPRPS